MSENTLNLIQAIANGDAVETEHAFANAMAEKLSVKLDDMRTGIAQNMFNQEVVTEETLDESEEDHAGKFASEVVKKHPHMTVIKDPDNKGTHYLQHKDDEDGSYAGGLKISHSKKTGKISVQHHGTAMHDEPKTYSGTHEKMHAHVDNAIKHGFPKSLDD